MKISDIKYGALALMFAVAFQTGSDAKDDAKDSNGNAPTKSANSPTARSSSSVSAKITVVYDHPLPNVPGKSIKGVLVEYGPGGSSPCHTHPKSAFIYATVLEGEITSQVNNGPIKTYTKGQSFSEMPGDKHGISRNASNSNPAKLLAVFVLDTNEKELTTPCKD